MKLYAPSYYKRFKCIADKCKNSCCVDWEIDIDDVSYEKYREIGKALTSSISECDGVRCFKLLDNGKCPHLNDKGLCDIIINYGEEYLTDICREHPRFYHSLDGRAEVGIGLVCEEAARIIITNEEQCIFEEMGESSSSCDDSSYVTLEVRDEIIKIAASQGGVESKIKSLEQKYFLDPDIHTMEDWLDIISGLEWLDKKWQKLLSNAASITKIYNTDAFDSAFGNLLVYFIFRHVSLAESYENMRARIAFATLSVKIIKYLFERAEVCDLKTLISLARLYSSEIEYSVDNTSELIFELESGMI